MSNLFVRNLRRVPAVLLFIDNDEGFVEWRDSHPDGFVVNHKREPDLEYVKLHLARCYHLQQLSATATNWTSAYAKTCSESLDELRVWARKFGGVLDPCAHCDPLA
jgi:hypothetical protein